jgi:hypothetical protein
LRRVVAAVAGALLIGGAAYVATRETPVPLPVMPAAVAPSTPDAALWMRRQWLHAEPTDDEIFRMVAGLRQAGIRRVFPFLGPMGEQGTPGWKSGGVHHPMELSQVASFIRRAKALMPELQILPWTGGVQGRDVFWTDRERNAKYVAALREITEAGADGIHLNIEPVANGDPGFVELVRAVKTAIGPGKEVSVSTVAPVHPLLTSNGPKYWDFDYFRALCAEADELVIMGYDTWLTSPHDYGVVVADWTRSLARELPLRCGWRIGVPTYDDDRPHHKLDVETLEVALPAIRSVEVLPTNFRGIAIYASWTTDSKDWAAFDRLWMRRKPVGVVLPEPSR